MPLLARIVGRAALGLHNLHTHEITHAAVTAAALFVTAEGEGVLGGYNASLHAGDNAKWLANRRAARCPLPSGATVVNVPVDLLRQRMLPSEACVVRFPNVQMFETPVSDERLASAVKAGHTIIQFKGVPGLPMRYCRMHCCRTQARSSRPHVPACRRVVCAGRRELKVVEKVHPPDRSVEVEIKKVTTVIALRPNGDEKVGFQHYLNRIPVKELRCTPTARDDEYSLQLVMDECISAAEHANACTKSRLAPQIKALKCASMALRAGHKLERVAQQLLCAPVGWDFSPPQSPRNVGPQTQAASAAPPLLSESREGQHGGTAALDAGRSGGDGGGQGEGGGSDDGDGGSGDAGGVAAGGEASVEPTWLCPMSNTASGLDALLDAQFCSSCHAPAHYNCIVCQMRPYCTPACAKQDWGEHQFRCFAVEEDEEDDESV